MVQLYGSLSDGGLATPQTAMQNGTAKLGRGGDGGRGKGGGEGEEGGRRGGVMTNGTTSIPQKPRPRTPSIRQERNSCSSTVSCPVFSGSHSDQDFDPPPRCPSSLSSPTLQGSLASFHSPKGSVSSLQGSTNSLHSSNSSSKGSISSLNSSASRTKVCLPSVFGSLSSLQGSLPSLMGSNPGLKRSPGISDRAGTNHSPLRNLRSPTPSLRSPSPSLRSPSPSLRCTSPSFRSPSPSPSLQSSSSGLRSGSSSEDDSWDTNSWSSGATCLLRSSIKQHSQEVFLARAGSGPRLDDLTSASDSENIYQNLDLSALGDDPGPWIDSRDEEVPKRPPVKKEIPQTPSRWNPPQSQPTQQSHNRKEPGQKQTAQSSHNRKESPQSQTAQPNQSSISAPSAQRVQRLENRLKFSQFLDEVACSVLGTGGDPPFSPLPPKDPAGPLITPPPPASWSDAGTGGYSALQTINEHHPEDFNKLNWCFPSCKVLAPGEDLDRVLKHGTGSLKKVRMFGEDPKRELKPGKGASRRVREENFYSEPSGKAYLETDIDFVRQQDELEANGSLEREDKGRGAFWDRGKEREKRGGRARPELFSRTLESRSSKDSPCPVFSWPEGYPRVPFRSTSLPRPVVNSEPNGEMPDVSSFHDHKEDLRKRLSYTTHKLEMVESEFDSTRQYLETELRRAQEELDKFTDKLRRIQSSYAALQRINQDLEDKMHRTTQHHEDEKRALSREIIVLNNHLMEAKLTIEKLRDDNDLYRKDCNLAAQLLQCSKSHYRAHKLSELPVDFQERVSTHIEKHGCSGGVTMAMCHSPYSDAVPTAIIAKVLEKPEPGNSCPVTRTPSPAPQDGDFLSNSMGTGSTDQLSRRTAYKTSDLYSSDTALYCPERWQERRQSVDVHGGLHLQAQLSTDSNPEEEAFMSGNFMQGRPPSFQASSSYSSFSVASDEKGEAQDPGSTLSSSHQGLYMDWRDDYEHKSTSSYDKDTTSCYDKDSFPKSLSFQNVAPPRSPQMGAGGRIIASPAYTRTASCYSEPYHPSPTPSPRLASSHSMGTTSDLASALVQTPPGDAEVSEEDLSTRWRQLSVDELSSFSFRDLGGRVSPYSFSERHFALGPAKAKHGPLYSSFQEGDHVFHSFAGPPSPSPSPSPSPGPSPKVGPGHRKQEKGILYRAKQDSQDSECSLFLSVSSKEKESTSGTVKKDYVDVSPNSSAESLQPGSLEPSKIQHYQRERPSSSSSTRPRPSLRPSSSPRPSSSHGPRPRPSSSLGPALPEKTSPRYQKFGSTGLTRKDSLTKAQLYGTLLN